MWIRRLSAAARHRKRSGAKITIPSPPGPYIMTRVLHGGTGIYKIGLRTRGTDVAQNPKYSIVIPAYNEGARIPATLRSVVDTIRARGWDAEVVVVNDGSRDNTAEVVGEFTQTYPEIRLLENPENH